MVKGLVSFLTQTFSEINDLRYFGDVVVYQCTPNDWEGRLIRFFTKNEFTHCALRTGKNKAEGIRLKYKNLLSYIFPSIPSEDIKIKHDLENPREDYQRYVILRHKDMTLGKRIKMKFAYKEMKIRGYDLPLFLGKAWNYKLGKLGRKINLKSNFENGMYLCGSTPGSLFHDLRLKLPDIEWHQIEPQHFVESDQFVKVHEWIREENPEVAEETVAPPIPALNFQHFF